MASMKIGVAAGGISGGENNGVIARKAAVLWRQK